MDKYCIHRKPSLTSFFFFFCFPVNWMESDEDEGEPSLVEVARVLHLASLTCNQTLSLSFFATTSQDSVDGSWDKASILGRPRPFLVLFQATALRHRPFCMEHPEARTGGRSEFRGGGGEAWKKVGGGFVQRQTAVSPPPTLLLLLLPLLGWYPGLFPR